MDNPYKLRPVTAPEYFVAARGGRGAQARRLLRGLCAAGQVPDNLSLVGERRYGKTSLLGFLQRSAAGTAGLRSVGVNMMGLSPPSPDGFYLALTRALIRAGTLAAGQPPLSYLDFEDYLHQLDRAGERLVLFLDEFDLVARDQRFPPEFFDHFRSIANDLPLTLVVASVRPIAEIAHSGIYGSPFFNIFYREFLRPLSLLEAEALIGEPPGGKAGLAEFTGDLLALAGQHPYFLQLACMCAWDQREAGGGNLDRNVLRAQFRTAARDQYQYIWDHSDSEQQKTMCALVRGVRSAGSGLDTLVERGYVVNEAVPRLAGEGLAEFVQAQCAVAPPGRSARPCFAEAPTRSSPGLPALAVNYTVPQLRLALVVGVNDYQHQRAGNYFLPPLRFAERDAEAMADFLTSIGYMVTRLTGPRATCAALRGAFAWMKATTAADPHPHSSFVFHFSGHGQLDPHNDEAAHLMLQDSDPRDPGTTGLEMTQLVYELLPQVRVPNALVLLDACHAGFAAGVKDLQPLANFANITQQLFSGLRGRMVLAACAGEAQAREAAHLGHGLFTNYVLRHWRDLEGAYPAGRITFGSLVDYVGHVLQENHPHAAPPVYNGVGVGSTFTLRSVVAAGGP